MKTDLKPYFIHFFASVFFVLVALLYFSPVLQGKKLPQSDIRQYKGMAQEQTEFKKETGEEPYWTNSAFGGMPTYQLGANYPHNYIKKLDKVIRFLPRPADYLFLYFIGFYILLSCMKVDYRLAILGALAFGFSTYMIIILGVGHNAKAHALGYLPMLLGGILLVFRKKYLWGFILSALAMALEVNANHYQMTYYFMLLVLVFGAIKLVEAIRKKELKHFGISVGLLIGAVILGIATNATSLMATKEYADWSTRGPSQVTVLPDGSPKEKSSGLSREYITQWSYGISESLNLFVPRMFGGSNQENLGKNSKTYTFLKDQGLSNSRALDFTSSLPLYWGDQPGTSGPAYVGAILLFLCILGMFLLNGNTKWWLFGGILMSLFLSWGKNFALLTDFMIDYFPLYNKFRAVSSIQIVLELCVPVLAMLALSEWLFGASKKKEKLNAFKISGAITLGLTVFIFLIKGSFGFEGASDATLNRYFGPEVMAMIQMDRKAVYTSDLLRSLLLVVLTAGVLWLFAQKRLKRNLAIVLVGLFVCYDLVGVALRYVDKDDFVSKRLVDQPFTMQAVDKQILEDDGVYRVFNPQEGPEGAQTSYFHHSIGGYHAAKPRGMQELFDFHIYKNHVGVLNLLNVKYIIQQDEEGNAYPAVNPEAYGNAWFVSKLMPVHSADEELSGLHMLDGKEEALVNTEEFPAISRLEYQKDSTATIALVNYKPNALEYVTDNDQDGFAVFSEMYYAEGWQAFIDRTPVDHVRVDHVLRGLPIPAGKHEVSFKFVPKVVEKATPIMLGGNIVLGLILIGGILFTFLGNRKEKKA
ncbi:hypothetical protein [Sediminicola luteus]|uniref:Membrane protein YfhO n=1 Tax=Sediminicola luteus TaxID=319238 RepID=A0A2A4G846_9FLAO|nr:hypothetical protein [Sediminicola luteus]PCE64166.1 hypothetical protein B7P33_11335 [Sediminicola luteus]